jgi:hypothetical protein
MKAHLMRDWYAVQNGGQIDIHVRDKEEGRELTVACNVRDEECAKLIATASNLQEAVQQAKAETWAQAIQLIEDEQLKLWRVDSPEAEAVRWLVIALRRQSIGGHWVYATNETETKEAKR